MLGKHARRTEPEIEPDEQVAASPSSEDNERPRKHTGLFAEKARPTERHEREQDLKETEDQEKLRAERALRKAQAKAEAKAFLRRERQRDRDRSYDISR